MNNDVHFLRTNGTTGRGRALLEALVIVGAVFLTYGFTLRYPFHFDDHHFLVGNPVFHPPIGVRAVCVYLPTRAVANLSFALNALVGGLGAPAGFRLVNVLIHAGASLVVWRLAVVTSRTPALRASSLPGWAAGTAALISGLVFAVHPIQTQAITYIYQRVAALATFWYLAALWLYAESRLAGETAGGRHRVAVWRALSLGAGVLGMFTKEICFTLPLAVAVYELFFFGGGWRGTVRRVWPYALLFPIIPVTVLLGSSPMARAMAAIAEDEASIPRLHYLLTQIRVLVTYLRLLVLPVAQNVDYDYPVMRTALAPQVIGSALLLGLLALSVPLLYRRQRVVAFAVTWFFLTLTVEASVIPLHNVIFEHRLYLPMAGFAWFLPVFLATACGVHPLARRRWPLLVGALLLALTAAAALRNTVWRSQVALWDDAVGKSPGKARPYVNRGVGWIEFGRYPEAVVDLTRALELKPGSAFALNDRGTAWKRLGQFDLALADYSAALARMPGFPDALFNRGSTLLQRDRVGAALADFDAALRLSPHRVDIRINRGAALLSLGQVEAALAALDDALALDASQPMAYLNRGMAHALAGDWAAALQDAAQARRHGGDADSLEAFVAACRAAAQGVGDSVGGEEEAP